MAFFAADRVKVSTSTSGTADFGLSTAVSTAFQDFTDAAVPDGSTVHYAAFTATEFECGSGVYNLAGAELSRLTIYASSNGGAKVSFGSNPTVIITFLAETFDVAWQLAGPWIDARAFGVTGVYADNQTAAFQAAWEAAKVVDPPWAGMTIILPAGTITLDVDTIDLDGESRCISIVGQGRDSTNILFEGGSGQGLYVHDTPHCRLADFGVIALEEWTSGALLKCEDNLNLLVDNVKLSNGFICLDLEDNVSGHIRGCYITTGGFFTDGGGFKSGSRCLRTNGLGPLRIAECEIYGAKVQYGLEVIGCDILKIQNNHFYDCFASHLRFNSTNAIQNVLIGGNTFDNGTADSDGVIAFVQGASSTFQNFYISDNFIVSQDSTPALLYNGANLGNVVESNNDIHATVKRTLTSISSGGLYYTEIGSYSPTLTGSTTNPTITYTFNSATWSRKGRDVTVWGIIIINTYSGGSGNAQISLPFPVSNGVFPPCVVSTDGVDWGTGKTMVGGEIASGDSFFIVKTMENNAARGNLDTSKFAAGDVITWNFTYTTNT